MSTGAPVYQDLHGSPSGPCVASVCVPVSGVGKTTGNNPTVYVLVPTSSTYIPLNAPIPALCLWNNNEVG